MVYRLHNSPEHFQEYFDETVEKLSASGKKIIFMGDANLNLLRFHSCKYAQNFILSLQSFNLMPTINNPTRGVKIWNTLSCEVRQMSKSNFKNNVNDILFQRLLKYNDYIDVSKIIWANVDSSV